MNAADWTEAMLFDRLRPKPKEGAAEAIEPIDPRRCTGLPPLRGRAGAVSRGPADSGSGMTTSVTRSRRGIFIMVEPVSEPA